MGVSRLTRDGTAEPVSRDQIIRRELGQGKNNSIFPVQLTTSRIGNVTRLILTLAICDDHQSFICIPLVNAPVRSAAGEFILVLHPVRLLGVLRRSKRRINRVRLPILLVVS